MSVKKYEVLLKAVELGSLTRAAEVMGLTQSGVSHIVGSIESELGVRLLNRGRSRAVLTPEGELLLASDRGYMKRCLLVDFEPQARGGKGAKCFGLLKSGANGTKLVGAMSVRLPYDVSVVQQRSGETRINTEEVKIESRAARGTPYVAATALDPVVELRAEN